MISTISNFIPTKKAVAIDVSANWIALGQGTNSIAISPDGNVWTGITGKTIFSSYGSNAAYGNGLWVAVGSGSTHNIATSPDGINWTGRGKTVFDTIGYGVAYGNGRWVAVGGYGNCIATSTDGIAWTGLGASMFYGAGSDVAYNNGLWVAVGSGSTHNIATSPDGINWTGRGKTVFSSYGRAVAYGNGLWVALGPGSNTIATSPNGNTWTGLGKTIFSANGYGVAYGNGQWIGLGDGGNTIATSTNGNVWTGLGINTFSSDGYKAAYGNGRWVAVGYSGGAGNTIATSTNGTEWIGQGSSIFDAGRGVAFKPVLVTANWVAMGAGTLIAKSMDGNVWTSAATVADVSGIGGITNRGYGVAYGKDNLGGNLWVAVGQGGLIAKSTDGNTWTSAATNIDGNVGGITGVGYGVAYGKDASGAGLWVAVGSGGIIAKSTDGNTWTPAAWSTGNPANKGGITGTGLGVAYGKDASGAGLWVAVGYGGLIAKSTDGNTWTRAAGVYGNVGGIIGAGYGVAYGKDNLGGNLWVAVGHGGIIAKSTDGNVWTRAASSTYGNVGGITGGGLGVAYGKDASGVGLWVAVGQGGLIAKSTDGNVWTAAATSTYGNVGGITSGGIGVAYGKDASGTGLWVAVGSGGLIAKSTDGNVWTPAATSIYGNVGGITSGGQGVAFKRILYDGV